MSSRRVYAQIDLDAVVSNMEHMYHKLSEHTKMIAVIKADGYGHGARRLAERLEPLGYVFGFAVATAEEAFELRESGVRKPILILGYTFPEDYEALIAQDIRLTIFKEETVNQLSACAKKLNKKTNVHIKVDTGMSRIGVSADEAGLSAVKKITAYPEIEIEGIFTHFARADEADKTYAVKQLEKFQKFVMQCERGGIRIPYKHCSNSAGILELQQANLDIVRAGITIYGLWPSDEVSRESIVLTPAMSLKSSIVYIKTVQKDMQISYGGTYTAKGPMRIATIPVGYADGYPRGLSNKGSVLIRGKRAPITGRVCMDQFMVDVTAIPDAKEYDEVVLLGSSGEEKITAEELARLSGRFHYELVCDISKRVPRIYT
ncbi:MAG: alanine racemase [Lachnospiraceae bacterium]